MRTRWLMAAGIVCLLVAGSNLAAGFTDTPWLTLGAVALAATLLLVALAGARTETTRPVAKDPERGERLVRAAALWLAGFGLVAGVVAVLVAEGQARGHAVLHLLTGLLCLGLFAALAFPWHPRAGSGAATTRGVVLALLAVAAFGSFLESLGGSGYDAANDGRRIEALTTLHGIAQPFGAFLIVAVPLAAITGLAVLVARYARRARPVRI